MPATASHARTPAPERKPMSSATSTTTTSEIRLATSEVSTCAQSTDDRAIGMEWNRSKMPPLQVEEEPVGGVGDPGGDRDQQDAGKEVGHVGIGSGGDRAAEHVDEQQHQGDRRDRGGDDRVEAAGDVLQGPSGEDGGDSVTADLGSLGSQHWVGG